MITKLSVPVNVAEAGAVDGLDGIAALQHSALQLLHEQRRHLNIVFLKILVAGFYHLPEFFSWLPEYH